MSMWNEFDRLRNTVDTLFQDFDAGFGRGRRGSLGMGRRDPFMDDFGWDWGMGMGPTQGLLKSGDEDTRMMGGDSQALTKGGNDQRLANRPTQLPVLRCRVNVEDKNEAFEVTAEVPGFDKQNLHVNISDDNVLTISGEQKQEHVDEAKDKKYIRVERSFGSVQRSLRLPTNIDKNQVNASYENGILHVHVPKTKEAEKKQSQIQIA